MVKKSFLAAVCCLTAMFAMAQPPQDNTPTYPSGATYVLSNGSTVTKTGESLSSSTQYYNVVQVSNGALILSGCTLSKTGSGSSGDNSSFYGNNSTVYAGAASSTNYQSTTAGSGATINITNCTITSSSQGANAVFATNGATINVDGVTITNNSSVSRGLHATYGGIINAYDVDITTNSETSSTIATDRGSGTVTVNGGTATANGNNSAVLYSTGTITATNLTGTSAQGEIAVVEGDNGVIIDSCTMTSGSSNRGLMMLQSGSGDAQGSNAYITVSNSTLNVTGSSTPLCEVPTLNTGTLTLTDVDLNVTSGILMYVDYNTQWSTYGGTGNLILQTNQSCHSYTGAVDADSYSNVTVTVGSNVIWNGTMDADNNASTATVTVNAGGVWVLTGNSYVSTLVNNGTIYTNGYTLTIGSTSGSGTTVSSGTIPTCGTTTTGSSYTVSECGSYTWNGTTYTASGTYYYGNDTLNLTIFTVTNNAVTATTDSSYTWNGTTYTTSGTYNYSHTDDNGCTQVDTLYLAVNSTSVDTSTVASGTVEVVYSGTTATVSVASDIADYLTVTQSGAHVSIAQSSDLATEITYNLSGTSTDGEFYMSGSYKATIELDGLTLTNATPVYSGAAVHIQNGKRINVKVITGTTNTLIDAASGSQKGCLYIKGHAEFKQQGTLNITGNVKHGIKAGEYITLKNATLNITSAVGDGISCNQYFLMQSGAINISGTGDDGIQCDLEDTLSTGETADHEDEDSGNIYISGGTITVTCAATAAKGIKGEGDMNISGGTITVSTSGNGEWDSDGLETKAACGLSCDGNMNITGGTLNLSATSSGGKGMKCDGVMTLADGSVTVTTSGGLYYNNGTTENTDYTGNTDNVSSDYYSSPKGIKAGVKTPSGNSYTYSGGLVVSGGSVKVTTSGTNGEGMESKNYLNITGGEVFVNAYDDAINSAQDLTVSGGYVYARATNNDGMDANGDFYINGGLVYAIGASSPEVALDANTEDQKQLYISGGVVIAVGGIENGSSVTVPHTSSSSVSGSTWYTTSYGSDAVAFLTPTLSGSGGGPGGGGPGGGGPGGGSSSSLYVAAPSTPSVSTGNSVLGGSSLFEGNCYVSYIIDTTSSCVVYDTVSVTVYDTVTVTIHDTVRITVNDTVVTTVVTYDTTSVTVYDTLGITVYDTVDVSLCDTVYVTLPADTIYIYDTVYICDTVYVTQEGIGDIDALDVKLYQQNGQIVVEGADGNRVWLYDINGRLLATRQDEHAPLRFDIPASGAYLVKVGNHAARRIVVIR